MRLVQPLDKNQRYLLQFVWHALVHDISWIVFPTISSEVSEARVANLTNVFNHSNFF